MHATRLMALTAVIAGSLAASCASRRPPQTAPDPPQPTLVVLLPDADGTTGRARVSNEFGAVDLTAERAFDDRHPDRAGRRRSDA